MERRPVEAVEAREVLDRPAGELGRELLGDAERDDGREADVGRHAERDPRIGIIGMLESYSEEGPQPEPESTLTDFEYLGSAVLVIPMVLFDRVGMFDRAAPTISISAEFLRSLRRDHDHSIRVGDLLPLVGDPARGRTTRVQRD